MALKKTILELDTKGWERGEEDVRGVRQELEHFDGQSSSFNSSVTAISTGFLALKEGAEMALGMISGVLEAMGEWNKFSRGMSYTAQMLGTSQAEMINMVTRATRGQADNIREVTYAVNLLVKDVGVGKEALDEFMQLITARALKMGIEIDDAFSTAAEDITSGGFSDSLIRMGFDVETLKERFDAASTDMDRFRIIMQDLRSDTERSTDMTLEAGEAWKELSAIIRDNAYMAIQAFINANFDNEINDMAGSVRDLMGDVVAAGEALGTLNRWLNKINITMHIIKGLGNVFGAIREGMQSGGGTMAERMGIYRSSEDLNAEVQSNNEFIASLERIQTGERQRNTLHAQYLEQSRQAQEQAATEAMQRQNALRTQRSQTAELERQRALQEEQAYNRKQKIVSLELERELQAEITTLQEAQTQKMKAAARYSYEQEQATMRQEEMAAAEKQRRVIEASGQGQSERQQQFQQLGIDEWSYDLIGGAGAYKQVILGNEQMIESYAALGDAINITAKTAKESWSGAWSSITEALGGYITAIISGEKTSKKALLAQLKNTAFAIGKEALIRALFEGGMALASLAMWDIRGSATHGAAAAAFGGIAGITLGIGAALPGTSTSSAASKSVVSSPSSSERATQGPSTVTYYVNFSGGVYTSSRDIKHALRKMLGESGQAA